MIRARRLTPIALLLAMALLAGGCTTAKESFPGHSSSTVWSALVAVAKSPEYDSPDPAERWTVRENGVWIDEEGRRIEIFRRLARTLHHPGGDPETQARTWRFRVTLAEEPSDQEPPQDGETPPTIPTASFISRDWAIPSHVWDEALRYFDDVWDLLGGRPAPADEG